MPFRTITSEELAKLAATFEAAWMGVTSVQSIRAQPQSAARKRLAGIIFELYPVAPGEMLAGRAVERYLELETAVPWGHPSN